MSTSDEEEDEVICEGCGAKFDSWNALAYHMVDCPIWDAAKSEVRV